ncbi:hypothetical protein [Methylosinus sp. LW4]|uniref:hypothetical protein n=1 Tax=Methylosinus sp. LW4 TaxID=136993 RepID=UPI0003A1E884|nr:hypothetical protein [Methylosinus sp. LW4]
MTKHFTMGGTATFDFIELLGGYIVAMTGDFDGGAFARVVGEPRVQGNKTYLDMEHTFIRKDGSTIQTRDQSVLTAVEGEARLLGATTYNVVKTTGAFEGLTGQFRSWGSVDPATGQGVLRFWGSIGEASAKAA